MANSLRMVDGIVTIRAADLQKIFDRLREAELELGESRWADAGGIDEFSQSLTGLAQFLFALGWGTYQIGDTLEIIAFISDEEGETERALEAISPFAKGFLTMERDGLRWRWVMGGALEVWHN